MFGTVDTGKGWPSQVCPRAIGSITTCYNMIHSLSLPTGTYICQQSFHIFIIARHLRLFTLSRFKLLHVDQGSSVPLAKCPFGMIHLSRHSVERSPRALHSSTHSVVRASCLRCFRWVKKAVSGWKPVLGRALAMEWMSRVIFLEATVCVAGNISAYVGRGYPRQCIQAGYWGAFKQPMIILHVSFRATSTCPVCLERPHEELANSAVEKQSAYTVVCTVAGWAHHLEFVNFRRFIVSTPTTVHVR